MLSTRPWMRIYIGYRFQNKVCFKFQVSSKSVKCFAKSQAHHSHRSMYISHTFVTFHVQTADRVEAMLVSQTDQKKTNDGASGRNLRKSSNSSRALPGYSPQNSSPPPAYDHAVEAFNDDIPPKFRPQNLSDIRSMNLES